MKKSILFILLTAILLTGCSTSYNAYDYNRYFQNNEPFFSVSNEQEAAQKVANKLFKIFRRMPEKRVAVLNFTDEYGDRLNRGIFFADMIVAGVSYYRYPRIVERDMLYEIVKEQELSETNLMQSQGEVVGRLVNADAIVAGRILRGNRSDRISVRCFKVGTGEVIYAATISVERWDDSYYDPNYNYNPGSMILYPYTGSRSRGNNYFYYNDGDVNSNNNNNYYYDNDDDDDNEDDNESNEGK